MEKSTAVQPKSLAAGSVSQSVNFNRTSFLVCWRKAGFRERGGEWFFLLVPREDLHTHTHIPSGLRVSDDTVTWGPDGNIRYSLQRPWVGCWSWCLTSATSAWLVPLLSDNNTTSWQQDGTCVGCIAYSESPWRPHPSREHDKGRLESGGTVVSLHLPLLVGGRRGLEYANVLPKSGRRISFFADMLLCCSAALLLHAGRWVRSRSSGVCVFGGWRRNSRREGGK